MSSQTACPQCTHARPLHRTRCDARPSAEIDCSRGAEVGSARRRRRPRRPCCARGVSVAARPVTRSRTAGLRDGRIRRARTRLLAALARQCGLGGTSQSPYLVSSVVLSAAIVVAVPSTCPERPAGHRRARRHRARRRDRASACAFPVRRGRQGALPARRLDARGHTMTRSRAPGKRPGMLGHYLPDLVYGANDGIITTFAVVSGVVGADLSKRIISSSDSRTSSPTASPWGRAITSLAVLTPTRTTAPLVARRHGTGRPQYSFRHGRTRAAPRLPRPAARRHALPHRRRADSLDAVRGRRLARDRHSSRLDAGPASDAPPRRLAAAVAYSIQGALASTLTDT